MEPPASPAQPAADKPDSEVRPDPAAEKPSREWIRRAASRRLRANRPEPGKVPSGEYAPQFTAPREANWSPEFDTPRPPPETTPQEPDAERNWIVTAALACAGLLAVAMVAVFLRRDSSGGGLNEGTVSKEDRAIRQTVSIVPEVRRAVASFFAATTPEEKAAFVRGGSHLLPAMIAYYRVHPDEPTAFKLASNVEFMTRRDGDLIIVNGTTADGTPFETAVELTPSGPRLDWRYLTGAGDMEWGDWIAARPAKPVLLRGIGVLDDYYAGPFSDPEKWICLRVTDISRGSAVWAYADRNGPLEGPLQRLSGRTVPVKLQGSFAFPRGPASTPANISTPQVILENLLDRGWLDQSAEVFAEGLSPEADRGRVR